MRPASVLARSLAALAAVAVVALHAPTGAAAAPAAALPACAWATEISAGSLNELYPDSAAAYWVLPFPVRSGLAITLSGKYPAARYASVQVYQPGGGLFSNNGVSSALTDYLIQPDPGSVNPWQHWAPAGGSFTVTVQPDVAPGEVNTLPLAPAGVTSGSGYILYRVYLPPHRDFAAVPLPAVSFTVGGVSEQIPTCATSTTSVSATGPAPAPAAPASDGVVFAPNPGVGGGIVANADSAYLIASVIPPSDGDVIVIRGKAPVTALGTHPVPWPGRREDMRFYSMCVNLDQQPFALVVNTLPSGKPDYGCRHDTSTQLDRRGYYTYVVGTEAQRAAIQAIPGVTFLPFSAAQPAAPVSLMLRNMVVAPGFTQAVQDVPPAASAATAAAIMGAYYPLAGVCPLATLASRGAAACLPAAPQAAARGARAPGTGG
jgi:hypothetical protein